MKPRIAILIPCHNESTTIQQVIADFKASLPDAVIYVYDNQSTDNTAELAQAAGAIVRHVMIRGKGYVVRRMFADIDADIYVMVDGDATYDANAAPIAIRYLQQHTFDMVVCSRVPAHQDSFRRGHKLGNKLFTKSINFLFRDKLTDIFSGYRVFSRRFVKSFPAISQGFEIETEITIHALQLGLPLHEIATSYHERPDGSVSKLKTLKDGIRILRTIILLFLYVRPMAFFGSLFLVLTVLSLTLGLPVVFHFMYTGLVPRLPTAVLAAALGLLASLSLACGIVLDSVSRARLETKKLWYLLLAPFIETDQQRHAENELL